ncbi:MAG: LysR family transcriptional regulator [Mesorhizobium sp.]|uniref:LysR family transcriptional regulator n=7 Tax=Mesorhizobium TaxID=68287 RepID=UPI000FCAF2AC|nr:MULTISPECIES: LysR family transcriptional regulator [unclassified Mesorhizobium]RUV73059.1 LysR family transcriptional regulator [Mesorhizobium sp. M5C.F.Cr.IN.023.01.1.1]RWF92798.1 MAG: LysR family transcriptional regulator [Mesorhizobium sp.]RWI44881.1 MAG: LysR family transcriptional regulator [Mesorhizobium sp.]RWI66436.1 MAG: LysR family transcriptional regulator [Mesorhizobium sp.]RWJ21848.1 MAG: LysR family transcriptional regulator [Mesorhizobium sp.]
MLNVIDLSRADLNLLVLFEAVLEEGHVGRAADRLNLTASAVSHGLGRLRRLLNDPLFLRTPKGVVPTARATELAAPIADILARVRSVMATAAPFDPATAMRRFAIGAPDGVSAVILRPLLAELSRIAPRIDVGVRQILPSPARVWQSAIVDLEAHAIDIAIIPSDDIPPRFEKRCIYEEDFVIAMRLGHPFARDPTLERYCDMQHLVVSHSGDPYGFVDEQLAKQGRARRIALTVPNFMVALAVIAETDLVSALPRRFVTMHAARFGVLSLDAPLPLPGFRLNAVAPKVAMMDAGVAWLFDLLAGVEHTAQKHHGGLPTRRRQA